MVLIPLLLLQLTTKQDSDSDSSDDNKPLKAGSSTGLASAHPYISQLSPMQLAKLVMSWESYHLCVPPEDRDDDGKLGSTPEERQTLVTTFNETIDGYGIDELGMETAEFFQTVHAIGWRNQQLFAKHKEIVVPFLVVEKSMYEVLAAKQEDDNLQWVQYAVPDSLFFEAAKYLAKESSVKAFFFAMMSKPNKKIVMTHFHCCLLTVDAQGSLSPNMTVFGAEGDTHDKEFTKLEQYSLPYPDEEAGNRPKARHISKVTHNDGKGLCDNIQSALEQCGWSGMVCAAYVLNLMVRVILHPPNDGLSSLISMEKLIAAFHREIIARLTQTVKRTTAGYLSALKGCSLASPVEAVTCNPSSDKINFVQVVGLNHKLEVRVCTVQDGKVTSAATRSFQSLDSRSKGSGLYLLGIGAIAKHNTMHLKKLQESTLGFSDRMSDLNNMVSFLEDHPAGKVIPDQEGKCHLTSQKPPLGDGSVDVMLFKLARNLGYEYNLKAYCERSSKEDEYRVLFNAVLAHPMFGLLDVPESMLDKNCIDKFWRNLAVPASMKGVVWSTDSPSSFSQQTHEYKNCVWRSVSFNLGNELALDWTWLHKLSVMLAWKKIGTRGGATYAQMMNPKQFKLLFSHDKEQSVQDEAILFALKFCSPLRLFEMFPHQKAPSQNNQVTKNTSPTARLLQVLQSSGCGSVTGWPRANEDTSRTKAAKVARQRIAEELKNEEKYEVQQFQRLSDSHATVWWVGHNEQTSTEPRSFLPQLITPNNMSAYDRGDIVTVPKRASDAEKEQQKRKANKQILREASVFGNHETHAKFKDAQMHTSPATFGSDGRFHPMTLRDFDAGFKTLSLEGAAGIFSYYQPNKNPLLVVSKLFIEMPPECLSRYAEWGKNTEITELKMTNPSYLTFRDPGPRIRKPTSISSSSSSTSTLTSSNKLANPQS